MSVTERPGGRKTRTARYNAVDADLGSVQWPVTVQYGGDIGAPVSRGAVCEYNFGRAEEFSSALAVRAKTPKGLLLIDSVRLSRECLSHLLMAQLADFEIISLARAREAGDCGAFRAVVALMNVGSARLTDPPVLDDIAAILKATRHAPMLLLSEHGEAAEESRAAEVGVAGLFPSTCSVSLLIAAIHLVAAGGQFHIPSAPARFMISRLEGNGARR